MSRMQTGTQATVPRAPARGRAPLPAGGQLAGALLAGALLSVVWRVMWRVMGSVVWAVAATAAAAAATVEAVPLQVLAPATQASTTTREFVNVLGRTRPGMRVTVAGEPVPVYATGVFVRDRVPLVPGLNRIRVEAVDPGATAPGAGGSAPFTLLWTRVGTSEVNVKGIGSTVCDLVTNQCLPVTNNTVTIGMMPVRVS